MFCLTKVTFKHSRCSSSRNSLRGIHPVHSDILLWSGATSSFDCIFFTKCEQEKKSLLYLKVKDGTFKCVTTALLHKQKSDTSQDALKMSQNISIVLVKPDVGHAKGKN